MSDRVFVDTNIFVYTDDRAARIKRVRARTVLSELIRTKRAVVSTQVMQEYFAAAIKKLGLSPERARILGERLGRLDVVLIRPELILGAIDLCRCTRYRSGMHSSFGRPALPDADACSARICRTARRLTASGSRTRSYRPVATSSRQATSRADGLHVGSVTGRGLPRPLLHDPVEFGRAGIEHTQRRHYSGWAGRDHYLRRWRGTSAWHLP